jgi:gluconokinase
MAPARNNQRNGFDRIQVVHSNEMSRKLNSSVMSIDVGTSGVRAALFDERGSQIEGVQRVRQGSGDFAEINPDLLVDEVRKAINQLPAQSEVIAISTFWHSLMGVDASGAPTTPLLTWADTRATEQAKELQAKFDEREVHSRTGCRLHPSYWPAKLRWLKAEHPQKFNATHQWRGFGEYLSSKLFGEAAASVSMASATGLFNQRTCDWDPELIRDLGVPVETLPRISSDKTRIVVGDGAANNIGGNCTTKETIALMIGTSGAMRVVYTGEPPPKLSTSLWSYRVSRERVVVGGALSDGGGLVQWLVQSLNTGGNAAELQQQLAALEPDSHGLTILPFWSGERSTGWHAGARGGIFGLRQQTTTHEILRATLESIAYRLALIAEALAEIAPGASVIATGNALRSSPVWLQIIADVLGRPVMLGSASEASMRGAALLALEAVGKIGNLEAVPVSVDEVFEPDMRRHARYREGLARQQDLYERFFGETS